MGRGFSKMIVDEVQERGTRRRRLLPSAAHDDLVTTEIGTFHLDAYLVSGVELEDGALTHAR
jgi:hypothetical protein